MGVIIKGTDDTVKAADGSLSIEGFSIKTSGIGTFEGGVQVGSAATIYSNGNITCGIITCGTDVSISGSANFDDRRYILKTVDVPADSTVVLEKPINLGAGDKLETKASANGDIDVFASILEIT